MKRIFSIIIIICLLNSTVWVTGTASELSVQGDRVFLWEVRSERNTVYILGSIHLARSSIYPLDKRIEEAFNRSDTLAVEANIENFDPFVLQEMFAEKGIYSDGTTLRDHLSRKTFKLTQEKLANLGLEIDHIEFFKPWFLSITLMTFELLRLGFSPEYGVDKYFLSKAGGRKIVELESIDYQVSLLDSFDDKQQDLFLLSTISDLSIIEREMDSMIEFWESGDVVKLEEIITRSLDKYPEILPVVDKIFYQRNRKMAAKIERSLHDYDTHFVIVGAGHLVGKKGIIQLLKNSGYSPRQL